MFDRHLDPCEFFEMDQMLNIQDFSSGTSEVESVDYDEIINEYEKGK